MSTKHTNGPLSRYADLDEAIVRHIAALPEGERRHPIYCGELLQMAAQALGRASEHGDDKEWRLIDRRMQALRKAGRIRYERASLSGVGGWIVARAAA